MNKQSMVNGFVKRAQQYGFTRDEITSLVKQAFPANLEELKALFMSGLGKAKEFGMNRYNDVTHIPDNYKGMHEHAKSAPWSNPLAIGDEQIGHMQARDKHLMDLLKGVGTVGAVGGLGAAGLYGAGKAMSHSSQPQQPEAQPMPMQ
jgi:hypothetical protein